MRYKGGFAGAGLAAASGYVNALTAGSANPLIQALNVNASYSYGNGFGASVGTGLGKGALKDFSAGLNYNEKTGFGASLGYDIGGGFNAGFGLSGIGHSSGTYGNMNLGYTTGNPGDNVRLDLGLNYDYRDNSYGASATIMQDFQNADPYFNRFNTSLNWNSQNGFSNNINYTLSQSAADGITDFLTSMALNAKDVAFGAAGYVAGLFKDEKKERVGHITVGENDITAKAFQLGKFSGLKGEELFNVVNYKEVTNEYGGTGVLLLDANGKVIREIWNGAEGSFNIFDSNGKLARIKNLPAGADDAGFLDPIDNPISGILKNILKGSSRTILKAIDKKVVKETIEEGANGGTKLISQFSTSNIDDAVRLAFKDSNKVSHLFSSKHKFEPIISKLGGKENMVRAVLNAANGKLPASGIFRDITVNVGGQTIYIRGNVIDGVPRLGTMFIK